MVSLKDAIASYGQKPATTGPPYAIGPAQLPVELPAEAGTLSPILQQLARNYISARQRAGEALLEAARWLSEARETARHGEWGVFLHATRTSEGTANRLIDIHREALTNPQFAQAIRVEWLSFTAAAELARKSTPASLKQSLLNAPSAPTREEVKAARKQAAKCATVADLATPPAEAAPPAPQLDALRRRLSTAAEDLRAFAAQLADLTRAERTTLHGEIEELRAAIAELPT
jgi:hypothetical protein